MRKRDRANAGERRRGGERRERGLDIARMLEIPQGALSGMAQIELSGNREAVVDGCSGILEYTQSEIKINTPNMVVKFSGRGLRIRVMTSSSMVIEGFFTSVEFIT